MIPGAQLYSIRAFTQNERDFARSMKKVRSIGYRAVQISAVGSIPPQTLRNICDDNELEIALTHTDPERLRANDEAVMRDHEIMGCRYIGMGSMPERYRSTDWFPYFVEDYYPVCESFAHNGMKLMYHNHSFEWELCAGKETLYHSLLRCFPPELLGITLDTYWVYYAGADLSQTIRECAGRLQCVHFKDMVLVHDHPRYAPVGQGHGAIHFKSITEQLIAQGDTAYIFVEQDDCYGHSPFDCLQESYAFIVRECMR